ncbi:hypothetical protein SAMN05878482_102635 [Peribacillus simplex]|uniref:Uncharacterized protein n=1 Tax=Peribacillus simplex TaxID=1478 RepID=A0A9X8WK23_9BACI|nr:hypothetical protein SAMN05878482_102635 [Peribacillus simplex]
MKSRKREFPYYKGPLQTVGKLLYFLRTEPSLFKASARGVLASLLFGRSVANFLQFYEGLIYITVKNNKLVMF